MVYTSRLSSCYVVGCVRSPRSPTTRSSRGFAYLLPSSNLKCFGYKHCVVTLVERKTGYTLIGQLNDRTTKSTSRRTIKLMSKMPEKFKTITSDNGTKFHQYKKGVEVTNCPYYFANPHHSWERGTNENTNGLIRQYLAKGTSMVGLTQQRCNIIEAKLNTRPRKRVVYKTPEECFYE